MADIFGKNTYQHYRDLESRGHDVETYVRDNWANVPATKGQTHNFDALETRAVQGSTPLGYLSDNMVAVQAQTEEVLRTTARFERFMPVKDDIPEGAQTFGYRVLDGTGSAGFLDNRGTSAETVSASQILATGALRAGGNIAEYSDDELRAAMFSGVPLDTATVTLATQRCIRHMEQVAFTGSGAEKGLLNQPTTGSDKVALSSAGKTFAGSTGLEIATEIVDEIHGMIDDTNEVIGDVINGEIVVGLPPLQYGIVKSKPMDVGGSTDSVATYVMNNNGWTDEARGNSVRFERLPELKDAGASNATRMVVVLRDPRILQFPVAFMPRVNEAVRGAHYVQLPLEYKIGTAPFVARPAGIRYVDTI